MIVWPSDCSLILCEVRSPDDRNLKTRKANDELIRASGHEIDTGDFRKNVDTTRDIAKLNYRSGLNQVLFVRFERGAPNLIKARQTRSALSSEQLIHRSMSPVARASPCVATAYAPTSMNSTFSSQNADNMSRKSEFSNGFSLEGPRVQSELPHHLETLSGRRRSKVVVFI